MNIYHLSERDEIYYNEWAKQNNTWYSPYSMPHGFVVVAETEQEARKLAVSEESERNAECAKRWFDPELTNCAEIEPTGTTRVVMGDWPTG